MCGKTRTRAPRKRIARTMLFLSPRSTIPMRGPVSPGDSYSVTSGGDTWPTKSWSSQRWTARAAAWAAATSTSPGAVTMPRRQPLARRWRARARVSTPAIAGIRASRRSAASCLRAVEHGGRGVGDDQRPQPRADRLVVVGQPPVVADQRIGHDHDLAGVRGVRADLLVAGLARVDDEIAAGRDGGPEGHAREDGAVLERQQGRPEVPDPRIDDRARARRRWDDHRPADTTNPPASWARWARTCEDI